jgi:hypothetical protein
MIQNEGVSHLNRDTYHFQGKAEDIEKLHEERITEGEGVVRTPYEKLFLLKDGTCDLNWLCQRIKDLVKLIYRQTPKALNRNSKRSSPNTNPTNPDNS